MPDLPIKDNKMHTTVRRVQVLIFAFEVVFDLHRVVMVCRFKNVPLQKKGLGNTDLRHEHVQILTNLHVIHVLLFTLT